MILTDDKVLVKKCSIKTVGKILIPDICQETGNLLCEVVAVGPGRYNPYFDKYIPTNLKVGDKILVNNSVLPQIDIKTDEDGQKLYLIADSNGKVILEDGETIQ